MALVGSVWKPKRLSLQLEREDVVVSPSVVWRVLHRLGLVTRTDLCEKTRWSAATPRRSMPLSSEG